MQIVVTAFLDESRALVEESTLLVDLYQDKHPDFPQRLIGWLRGAEETLKRHRRTQLAPMSALRARALAAVAGAFLSGGAAVLSWHHARLMPNTASDQTVAARVMGEPQLRCCCFRFRR